MSHGLQLVQQAGFFRSPQWEARRNGWVWLLGQLATVVVGKVAEPA